MLLLKIIPDLGFFEQLLDLILRIGTKTLCFSLNDLFKKSFLITNIPFKTTAALSANIHQAKPGAYLLIIRHSNNKQTHSMASLCRLSKRAVCLRMRSDAASNLLLTYIRLVSQFANIFTMAGYFPERI